MGVHGIFYSLTFAITNITFIVSIQNTNVANTLVMIAMAPMLSAILGGIFLKEMPDKKTWTAIIITFGAAVYIFYDSIQLGNFFGDFFGLVTALGLAIGAVIVRSAKKKDLVPAAVAGKLIVAMFAIFFVESFSLNKTDIIIVPIMCVMCVALPFVLVTIAPRFISAAEVNPAIAASSASYAWTSDPIASPRFVLASAAEVAPVPPLATGTVPAVISCPEIVK